MALSMFKNFKNRLKRAIYDNPALHMRFSGLNRILGRSKPPAFSGWGMTTESIPPWLAGEGSLDRSFAEANDDFMRRLHSGAFLPTQFLGTHDLDVLMSTLMWRHYFVFWSANFASKFARVERTTLVECGVCDGVTAFFAGKCQTAVDWRFYLYDAWEGMQSGRLLDSEKGNQGAYSYLSIENTQRNLAPFQDHLTYIKGYIPDTLVGDQHPSQVSWMHIDMNSAAASLGALEYFYDRIASGGLILFDDYGVPGYSDTRATVDKFFEGRQGVLLPTPTGQAIFFKL